MSDLEKEDLVLLLEREGEPIDDWAEDLQKLGHPVVPLRLVDEVVEDVVDLLSEKRGKFLSENFVPYFSGSLKNSVVDPDPYVFGK